MLAVRSLAASEYRALFPEVPHLFARVEFALAQAGGAGEPVWLGLAPNADGRPRLALHGRWVDGELISPWRSRFAAFAFHKQSIPAAALELALHGLQQWVIGRGGRGVYLEVPPDIYHPLLTNRLVHALGRAGYDAETPDIYHWLPLEGSSPWEPPTYSVAKDLKKARRAGLIFVRLESEEERRLAVATANQNRERQGRAVRLRREGIAAIEHLLPVDWWAVRRGEEVMASAVVYRMEQRIALIALWGDTEAGRECHAMHLLFEGLIHEYSRQGARLIDNGPSTIDGQPNTGLIHFKESFGCTASLRFRFRWRAPA